MDSQKTTPKRDFDLEQYVTDVVNGDVGLPMTFWCFGLLGSIVWMVTLISLSAAFPSSITAESSIWIVGLFMVYLGGVFLGIWRAADKYTGTPVWQVLAKFSVVVSAIPIGISYVSMLMQQL